MSNVPQENNGQTNIGKKLPQKCQKPQENNEQINIRQNAQSSELRDKKLHRVAVRISVPVHICVPYD